MKTEFVFIRKEKKYLIDETICEQLKAEVTTYLMRERFKKSGDVSFVKSIYLDNCYWKTYYDHKNREGQRFKVRIRQYGFSGEECFVELKKKIDGVTFKSRFKIKKEWIGDFLKGKDILFKLSGYNKAMSHDRLVSIYREIKERIEFYQFEPVVLIKYQRESFKNRDKKNRITFDRNLCFEAFQNSFMETVKEFDAYPANTIIMETKTTGGRPDWLKELVSEYGLKKHRFSKYCTSIETIYRLQNDRYERIPSIGSKEKKYARIS